MKDGLLFGDCGIAAVLERTDRETDTIGSGVQMIGSEYRSLAVPYGMFRHLIGKVSKELGVEKALSHNLKSTMDGTAVFTFSIKDTPKAAREFLARFDCEIGDYDLISIHQANKMIVENVAKRIKAPAEKVLWSLDRYGNTSGASTAMNICDYAGRENVYQGTRRVFNLAFGVGLSVSIADFELDMSAVLPVVKTAEAFDDGIDSSVFSKNEEGV